MAPSAILNGIHKAYEVLNSGGDVKQKQIDSSPLTKVEDNKTRLTSDWGRQGEQHR